MSIKFTFSLALLLLLQSMVQTATAQIAVTVNRKAGQPETTTSSVIFTAVYSSAIIPSTFTASSIILSGTATNSLVRSVFQDAPYNGTTFTIVVSADNNGSIIAKIPANITTPSNAASTSLDNGYVLPVNLLYFTAAGKECTTKFNWKSSSEINNSYYGIESSADGKAFTAAVNVASKNSAAGATYTYTLKEASGTTYYRLKMADKDGNFSYSKTVTVTATGNCAASTKPAISPNPAKDFIFVEGIVKGNHLSLLNAGGKLLRSMEVTSSTESININQYANGIYMLRIEAADGSTRTLKVVKQ